MTYVGWHLLREFETGDDALPLRRFMDFSKFQHLMNTRTLYLAPASAFNDKLEGHYTSRDYEAWDKQLADWGFDSKGREMASNAKATVARHNQAAVVISCWTMANTDDARMWEEYTGSPEAVVVETTVGRLRAALGAGFLIVPVRYLDFVEHQIPREHSLEPFCYKQNRYKWEREVRVIGEMELGKRIGSPREAPVSLSTLVAKIGLHSKAPHSFVDSVLQLVRQMAPSAACEVVRMERNV
jgi:hypothetical protein